ncbi:hypothetical protein HBH98_233900 [Parastagonospora nodorum]|uniref:Uncharacterized protein n=2 Tax=Phaeosphaeria nodorum (strain SN15 / ATCC MYA-4574 / FGSC 10173) TaxID=321614 RepID=A0A7U2ID40_PHANO|nr:hypothetical protein SNOG_16261 [Parastagonospora nodorum SN15]KAH3921424.1 hypothetical protein HBH54_239900 [Parastagonospora nodorum]EAT76445.1 hypothetical protein SNOG_16261 [Parastagonospora nodorum SN15]KAH3967356.1 hypothetical protein HBH52_188610 [Parastagonospora nodorum]KAH4062763.1 hypothetical protein HBH50_201740 [Parastagonospora nodorum]KAH4081524.1 hypothetical protein HBH48_197390 [Parastagonospora nodorum]
MRRVEQDWNVVEPTTSPKGNCVAVGDALFTLDEALLDPESACQFEHTWNAPGSTEESRGTSSNPHLSSLNVLQMHRHKFPRLPAVAPISLNPASLATSIPAFETVSTDTRASPSTTLHTRTEPRTPIANTFRIGEERVYEISAVQ